MWKQSLLIYILFNPSEKLFFLFPTETALKNDVWDFSSPKYIFNENIEQKKMLYSIKS